MRKWHRWLSVFFGVFMLWTAVTGVLSQVVPWTQGKPQQAQNAPLSAAQPNFVCPPDVMCRPKGGKGPSIVGLLHHLHSGEQFGPLGELISTLTGLALVFFSVSGIWLYVQMWRFRGDKGLSPKWFWK